jgi:endoglucanase
VQTTRKTALAAAALALAVAAAVFLGWGALKRAAKAALAWPVTRERARLRAVDPPFAHLAASQVGYAPGMRKQFTAPERFDSFRVLRESDGTAAMAGGGPVQERATRILGSIGTVWVGDFSTLREPGRYRIVTGGGRASHPFDVGADAFDRPLRAAQRGFYFQRAFTAIDAAHAEGPWVHASDAAKAPPGVRMGWHDAGDFSIYSASLNSALFWLLETWSDFAPEADDTNIPESGNGVPDLLDEARWGLEWLLSVQDAEGAFRNSTCEEGYGPYGANAPESVAPYRAGEAGTLSTARAVGNLAYASAIYRRFDPAFAQGALAAARRGEIYLRAHPDEASDGPTCPAYRADGDARIGRQTRMFAAAGMLLATGEARFRDDFERNYVELESDPSYMNVNGFAAQLYLRAPAGAPARKAAIRERLRSQAARVRESGDQHPFQLSAPTHWGSIGAGFTRAGAFSVKRCLEDPAGAAADCEQALANLHYAFGRNSLQFCYMSGLPGVTRGRAHAFHQWLAALQAQPFLFPGMIAGGPNASPEPADGSNPRARPIPIWGYWGDPAFPRDARTPLDGRYTDNDSWSTNEVSLDWQAPAVYALHFARWVAKGGR